MVVLTVLEHHHHFPEQLPHMVVQDLQQVAVAVEVVN
jgi:hypothetical protein